LCEDPEIRGAATEAGSTSMRSERRDKGMSGWRRVIVWLPLIVIVALALRAGFAWDEGRKLPAAARATAPFYQEAGNIARSLALGKGCSDLFRQGTGPTAWLTPVYPLLLAGIFRVFGIFTAASFAAAVALNIIFSAATCVPIFYAGRKIGGVGVGAAAAWLWAVYPNAIMIPFEWIWDTCLTTLLAALILWFTLKLAETQRKRDWILYGLLWGFALMTNPALATLLPFFLGWAAWRAMRSKRDPQRVLALAGMAILTMVLCCAPWTVRNYVAFHRFVPLRSNFPFTLWLSHNRVWDPRAPWNARISAYEQDALYKRLGENAFMQQKWNEAVQFIRTHPRLEVDLFARRFVAFWMGIDSPVDHFVKAETWWDRILLLANFLVALGTAVGSVAVWIKRRRYALFLSAAPLVFPWLYYVTQPYLRYRQPIDPILMVLIATAAAAHSEMLAIRTNPFVGSKGVS
jgi:Dolichyl-phosphate-mannose-protein mannosyltransferase